MTKNADLTERSDMSPTITDDHARAREADPRAQDEVRFRQHLLKVLTLVRSTSAHCVGLFAQIPEKNIQTLYPLNSARVAEFIQLEYLRFNRHDPDEFLTRKDIRTLIEFLRAKAHEVAKHRPVFKAVAWLPEEQELWIDLRQENGECIRITRTEWRVEEPLHPLFVRYPNHRPLACPEISDEGPAAFERQVSPGMSADDQKLLLGTLLSCFLSPNFASSFSFPVIAVIGESGAGKSTLCRFLKTLIDNAQALTANTPKSVDDLFVTAQTAHLIAWDNIDKISPALSDAICGITTGTSHQKRKLYTDDDQVILTAHAPVLLNGIRPDISRSDLLDRTVLFRLPRISQYDPQAGRHSDADLPLVMGYLMDLLRKGLANLDQVKLTNPPRLAMVAQLATAAEPFGTDTPFVDLLVANQKETLAQTEENHPVVEALLSLMKSTPSWKGTYKELLIALGTHVDADAQSSSDWPRTPKKLGLFLTERVRMFRVHAIEVQQGPRINAGRTVMVRRLPGFTYRTSP